LGKSVKQNSKKKHEYEEFFNESKHSKLVSTKKKLNNIVPKNNIGNKLSMNSKESKYFTEKINKVPKNDILQKFKSKNIEKYNSKRKNKKQEFKKSKMNEKINSDEYLSFLSEERLKAYGLNPKKFRNKLKYIKNN
jgi:protein KRI1